MFLAPLEHTRTRSIKNCHCINIFCKCPHQFTNCIKIYWLYIPSLLLCILYSKVALLRDNFSSFFKIKLVSYYVTGYYVTSSCQSESRTHTQKRSTMTKESSEGELLKKKVLVITGKGLKNYRRQTLSMKR